MVGREGKAPRRRAALGRPPAAETPRRHAAFPAAAVLGAWLAAMTAGCRTPEPAGTLSCRHENRCHPRPLQIHAVRCDLRDRRYEPAAVVAAPDPDGDGPAETRLAFPEMIVSNRMLLAAINANPFSLLPAPGGTRPGIYLHGWPAVMQGAVVADGVCRSRAGPDDCTFWVDAAGRPRLCRGMPPAEARQAVGGFAIILADGLPTIVPDAGASLAPRSAVGFDRRRRNLWLVVVDGRRPGLSEGVTTHELAVIMRELGCSEAINLDGGGSSALFFADNPSAPARLVSRPSGLLTRPVPVMLGIRRRQNGR